MGQFIARQTTCEAERFTGEPILRQGDIVYVPFTDSPVLSVNTATGVLYVRLGQWLVYCPDGAVFTMSHEAFQAHFGSAEAAAEKTPPHAILNQNLSEFQALSQRMADQTESPV